MKNAPLLGVVGAGCIGRRVAQAVADGDINYQLRAVCDIDADAAGRMISDFAPDAEALDIKGTVAACDVVVEAASAGVVAAIVAAARESHPGTGRPGHLLVMSVGGLLEVSFADDSGPVIHVPAGALGGLDAVQGMAVAGLDTVQLTTRKPPAGLGLELDEEKVLFEGTARDVIAKYPKNVNVAIALSFAGIGPDRTMVKLVADPGVDRNTHNVKAIGPAGEVEFTSRNEPFPENPKTSYLAALSAVALLKRLSSNPQVG